MKLGTNLVCFVPGREGAYRTHEEAARLCREAGFEYVDCHVNFTENPEYLKIARDLRSAYDRVGVRVHQIHMPLFRFRKDEDSVALFRANAPRAMECAAILGAEFAVVHADEYRIKSPDEWDAEKVFEITADYMAPVVELGRKYGILPAVENLYEDHLNVPENCRSRFSGETEEIIALADAFNGGMGICWDFGHGQVAAGEKMPDELRKVGKRLVTTHIHDNHSGRDLHLPPFFGKVEWEKVMPYLGSIGYDGPLSLELLRSSFPDGLIAEILRFLYADLKVLAAMTRRQ